MSRIPQSFIDDLLNRIDIVDVVDHRVKLKKTGKNYAACCPFHEEKTPSFTVSPDKQFYYCFGCGATGNAIGFIMEYDRSGFVDAVENLAKVAGLEVPREQGRPEENVQHGRNKRIYETLDKAALYFQRQLKQHPARNQPVNYLKNRGLTGIVARDFGLGYAPPGWDNLLNALGLNEEDIQLLIDSGLAIEREDKQSIYDRFRHRIMFPIRDTRGRTIGFGGRVLGNDKPKYLNSPETEVFHKGKELYGLYEARKNNRQLENLIVVEGYMDVIALTQYGITNAVATLGTACGEEHLRLSFRYVSEVVFCFDGDEAGRTAAKRALTNSLSSMEDGRQIKFLFLPEGQDPDSLVRQIGADRFKAQIKAAIPLEEFLFEAAAEGIDIQQMDGRAKFSKIAAPLINKLPQGIFRELMFENLAKRTGLSTETLRTLTKEEFHLVHEEASPQEEQSQESALAPEAQPSSANSNQEPYSLRSQIELNPARMATILLLENPELLQQMPPPPDLSQYKSIDDYDRLAKLVNYLTSRPDTSFNKILGYWGGVYGIEQQQQLAKLVANQLLSSARSIAQYDSAKELRYALLKIENRIQRDKAESEINALKAIGLNQLSNEQKNRLKELISQLQAMKKTESNN